MFEYNRNPREKTMGEGVFAILITKALNTAHSLLSVFQRSVDLSSVERKHARVNFRAFFDTVKDGYGLSEKQFGSYLGHGN